MPIKAFASAKARLAQVLSPEARTALAMQCATTVLAAAGELPVFVVCNDPEVAAWATQHGATVVEPPRTGLNEAVEAGRNAARQAGYARILIVHSDLPNASHLASLADVSAPVVIVPDRHDDGTNAMVVPTDVNFKFAYGVGSCNAHCVEARRLGLRFCIVARPDLALDLDTEDDLRAAGLLT